MGAGDAVFGMSSILTKINTDIKINAFISNLFGALKIKILGHEKKVGKIGLMKSINYMIKENPKNPKKIKNYENNCKDF